MSPEQVRAQEVDARADLFSFGAVLYQMATGALPFRGESSGVIFREILDTDPVPAIRLNPDLPPKLEDIIHKALEKDRELRYQHASEMRADLKRLRQQAASHPSFKLQTKATSQDQPSRPLWQWLGWLGLFATGMVGWVFWLKTSSPAPRVLSYTPLTRDLVRKEPPLLTDGTRLYFTTPKKTGWTIAEVSASGGETLPVPSPFDDIQLADISPDGSHLLVESELPTDSPLYILPLPAGQPRRAGNILAHDASWSTDGQQIVYAQASELYTSMPDGSESRRLATLAGPVSWPRWSPDGKILRFTVEDPKAGSESLWEISRDGTNLHPLLPGWSIQPSECCGSWTPNGKYFVFQSQHLAKTSTLWAIRESYGFLHKRNPEPMPLTTGPSDMFSPVPSRDGKKLFAIQGNSRGELVHYEGKSQQFVPYLSGISAVKLDFSKDGQWVAYTSYPDGTLWRSKADGTDRLQLTFSPMFVNQPQWSHDGKRIAFGGNLPGQPSHVYVVSVEDGTVKQVTHGERAELCPNWSMDDSSLFFGNLPDLTAVPPTIHQLNLKNGQVSALGGSEGFWYPRLSPDEHYIAAITGALHPMLFDLKTQKWTELSTIRAYWPTWSRDGQYLYFSSIVESEPVFYRLQIRDHKLQLLTSLKDVQRPTGGDASSWTGLAFDGSLLALRDISTFEIYALDWEQP